MDQLARLAEMRDRGVLTEAEFQAAKTKLLAEDAAPGVASPEAAPNATTPPKTSTSSKGCIWVGVLAPILLVGGCVALISSGSNDDSSHDGTASAIVLCRDSVKKQLKSPSTAKFGWGNESTTTSSGTTNTGVLHVVGIVDAENSFGAAIRSSWSCDATVVNGDATRAIATLAGS